MVRAIRVEEDKIHYESKINREGCLNLLMKCNDKILELIKSLPTRDTAND